MIHANTGDTSGQLTTAVVVGASIAGLCAARVLADHCERVVVVEADELKDGATGTRKGVPQARYLHALLQGGERALEQLFPGLGARLAQYGALRFDIPQRVAFLRPGGWAPPMASGVQSYCCSRPLTERVVRELFREQVEAQVLEGHKAVGLRVQREGTRPPRVTGVELRRSDGSALTLEAQLVVDAAGRGSPATRWLASLGAEPVPEQKVDAHVTYATRWYEAPTREKLPPSWWWDGLWVDAVPGESPTLAVLSPAEGGRWACALAHYAHGEAPRDEDGFQRQLRALRTPLVAEAVELATPISDVCVTRSTVNHRRHYERGEPRALGLLAVGDAACALNPAYGQGMTVAAQTALILAEVLRELGPRDRRLSTRFFRRQAQMLKLPWALSTGVDLQFDTTDGPRSRAGKLIHPFVAAVLSCAYVTPSVLRQVMPIFHLSAGMSQLFRPALLASIAAHHLGRRLGLGARLQPTAALASGNERRAALPAL